MNTLSVVLSVVCILTDIMQRSSISISSVEYSFGEPISKLARTGVVLWETPYWQDGRLVASRPVQIPQPAAPTTRRRRGFECLHIDGVPHLSSTFSGISDFECRVGGILGREARCDSGAACFNKNRIDCVPNQKCQLGAFEPCIVDRTCALLPASWKGLKLVNLTAFSCLIQPGSPPFACIFSKVLDTERLHCPAPCEKGTINSEKGFYCARAGSAPLKSPRCLPECQNKPKALLASKFTIDCPSRFPKYGFPCTVKPFAGYVCSSGRVGCDFETTKIKCTKKVCTSNISSAAPCDLAHKTHSRSPSVCEDGEWKKPVCARIETQKKKRRTPRTPAMMANIPIPSPPPKCCNESTTRKSSWNGKSCVCELSHLKYRPVANDCCEPPTDSKNLFTSKFSLHHLPNDTTILPCSPCIESECENTKMCYGMTTQNYLLTNGSRHPGREEWCRVSIHFKPISPPVIKNKVYN